MIDAIISTCFHRRGIAWLASYSWRSLWRVELEQLPIEAYPDIADVTSIVTQVPGLAPKKRNSRSPFHWSARCSARRACMCCARAASLLSLITVVFEDGTDGYFARQRLQGG